MWFKEPLSMEYEECLLDWKYVALKGWNLINKELVIIVNKKIIF